eukprot:Seg2608.1 transcript_id=Seg2608.1/GoldUCD/mRNA.D3Y31 product="L-rhamnose-binding lectin CSL3" protein_id=Seg2608.1/GoldUCD/D3Y31
MHYFWRIATFVCCIASKINGEILRLPCKSYANYSITKHDVALQGYVIATFLFTTENECKSKCLMNQQCKSFNKETRGDMKCELNDKTTEDWKDNVTVSKRLGWTFKTTDHSFPLIGQVCEARDPCPKGVTCRDTCTCPGYQCYPCMPGRTGLQCDRDINECESSPCLNGGTCNNLVNKYTCICDTRYTGTNCESASVLEKAEICESGSKQIKCDDGLLLKIEHANFGRLNTKICSHTSMSNTNCRAATSLTKVKGKCDGKVQCTLLASSSEFGGDPCPGTFKYLTVQYRCI